MIHDRPDYDHEIAKALETRAQLQARYDACAVGFPTASACAR
jgi:hypothetical protein